MIDDDFGDESYFEQPREQTSERFDAELLREPLGAFPLQRAITLSPNDTVTDAIRAMQRGHFGCVLVTDDGTSESKLTGIFTERDVLFRVADRGQNPASLTIGEVMTSGPETLSVRSSVAEVLSKMSVGGFRHVPVVDDEHRPACVISVRDVVSFLVDAFPREVLNLPTESEAAPPRNREGA